jgi:threonine/homoserine/homoserine lactone efflux protein
MIRAFLRRSPAVAAALLAGICASLLLSLAHVVRVPVLPLGIGLACGALLAYLAGRARLRKRTTRGGARVARPKVPTADREMGSGYDLAKDKSTDGQRWLM